MYVTPRHTYVEHGAEKACPAMYDALGIGKKTEVILD